MSSTHPYVLSAEDVAAQLDTDLKNGLSGDVVKKRLEKYGTNELREEPPPTLWKMLIAQFNNFIVILLIVAAAISGIVGIYTGEGLIDAAAILLIVVLNATLGVVQEGRAEAALRALKKMSSPEAHVIRDGIDQAVPSPQVVPGDLVILETGNYVPADMRLAESFNLTIDEASLTGESLPAEKYPENTFPKDAPLGDRSNMAHMGSLVTYGRGRGIITSTGMDTEIGHIAEMIQSYEEEATPLQSRLDQLGKWLGIATLVICAIVFVEGLYHLISAQPIGNDIGVWLNTQHHQEKIIELFMVAVSLAIAAVPEGLPAVVTIALALGMQRMIKRHALIRKLASVETLGSANVICSDKTGTLTTNEMTVKAVLVGGELFHVTGEGYAPEGDFSHLSADSGPGGPVDVNDMCSLRLLGQAAALCNDAQLVRNNGNGNGNSGNNGGDGEWKMVGDPTEGALMTLAAKAGMWGKKLNETWARVAEVPFDSDRKRMTTIHKTPDVQADDIALPRNGVEYVAFIKGAPEMVLELCSHVYRDGKAEPLSHREGRRIRQINQDLASQALRVLALAYRPMEAVAKRPTAEEVEKDLIFIGLAGMHDPARPEVKDAIAEARGAGIRTVMITGDYPDTAAAVARELNLLSAKGRVLTGRELDQMGTEGLAAVVNSVNVYARVSPANKVQIVEALKDRGYIVAMTGDGVNDAPALKRAHIGVAMGITGTDVSKQTADMVLTDDNYASIVSAVEEGRVIYSNIRKFVYFLISCNVGEIAIIFLSMMAGLPIPLLPIHLLWLNLVTDGAPALALGMEEGEPDIMKRKPRPSSEPIITPELWMLTAVQTVLESIATLGAFVITLKIQLDNLGLPWNAWNDPNLNDAVKEPIMMAQTVAFGTLVMAELLRAFTARSERYNIWQIGFTANKWMLYATGASFVLLLAVIYLPFLQPIFSTVSLNVLELEYIIPLALLPSIGAEMAKFVLRKRDEKAWAEAQAQAG